MLALSLFSAVFLAGQASAFAHAIQARDVVERFVFARQAGGFNPSEIPQQCQSTCASTASVLSGTGCQTDACLCTSTVNTGFQQCLSCILSLSPPNADLTQQSQDALVQFEQACASGGFPLSSLTISGATAAATGSGSSLSLPSGSASNTGIFFSSTPSGSATANLPSTPSGSATANLPSTPSASLPTRSVITPGPSSPTPSGSSAGSASSGSASSGERTYVVMSGVIGVVGGVMMVLGF